MSLSIGSVRSLAFLAIPIMLSHLSSGMMLFIDRLFIAQIGTDYINSAMMTNMVYATLTLTFVSLTSIAEVFVGQHNGAKHYNKLSQPVWQMIWLSLVTALLFIPMGLLTGHYILTPDHTDPYYTDVCYTITREMCDFCCLRDFEFCSRDIGICEPVEDRNLSILLDLVMIIGGIVCGFPVIIKFIGLFVTFRFCTRLYP